MVIREAIDTIDLAADNYNGIAEALNSEGIRTVTGKRWTSENVRKFIQAT